MVQVSANGGPFNNIVQLHGQPMQSWTPGQVIDLSAYAGDTIQIRFYFDTIDPVANDYRGWYIDDFWVANLPPALSLLPSWVIDHNTTLPISIDLWAHASDPETADNGLTYTITGAPPGMTIVGDRWLVIDPSTSWCGYADVTIGVTDPGGLWDTDTFRVAVSWSCPG
jgi:hypothetical protein